MDDARHEEVHSLLEAWSRAYDEGSPAFFDFFTPDASIFSATHPTRLEGLDAYRRYFEPHLGAQRRAIQVLDPEIRPVGESILVTHHSRIRTHYQSVDSRTTLLLVPTGEGLKIAHLHLSPLTVPGEPADPNLVEEVLDLAPTASTEGEGAPA